MRELLALWPALRPDDLAGTFPVWLLAAVRTTRARRQASALLAAGYLQEMRTGAGITEPMAAVLAPPAPPEQLVTALRVTSLVQVYRALGNGKPIDLAMREAFVTSSGAASRLVLDGGRETVRATAIADPRAEGWQRVGGGRSCDFCSMLIGRGAVYSEDTADFASHDHCGCSAEPVYR